VAVRNKFDDMLDRMTEVSDADHMPIETRMERLERIVQTILLALVEKGSLPPKRRTTVPVEVTRIPHGSTL
jgi:hypothetical protein